VSESVRVNYRCYSITRIARDTKASTDRIIPPVNLQSISLGSKPIFSFVALIIEDRNDAIGSKVAKPLSLPYTVAHFSVTNLFILNLILNLEDNEHLQAVVGSLLSRASLPCLFLSTCITERLPNVNGRFMTCLLYQAYPPRLMKGCFGFASLISEPIPGAESVNILWACIS